MLTDKPDICWNVVKSIFKACICLDSGFKKNRKSSAYSRHGFIIVKGSCHVPFCTNFSNHLGMKTIASMNSNGDKGSPCIAPLLSLIFLLKYPFIIICEQPVRIHLEIQFNHFSGNPVLSSP